MNRKELAADIISIVDKNHAYVFGGYVRDIYAEVPFNDIDIYIHNGTSVNAIIDAIMAKGYIVEVSSTGNDLEGYGIGDIRRQKYLVTHTSSGVYVKIDCVQSNDKANDSPFRHGTDGDINFLKLHGGVASLASCMCNETSFDEVVKHIQLRKFVVGDQMSQYRIRKLQNRGYTPIGVGSSSSQTDSSLKSIIVCDKCKGTGVLDFEFYTRTCECKLR